MAPMDAIWLVLVKTERLPATSWLPTHPQPPSPTPNPVEVLLVLAMPVKKLTKMVGNLASYSPYSW